MAHLPPERVFELLRAALREIAWRRPKTTILTAAPPTPRVSVIIPTYNWSNVLRVAITTVLQQTVRDFELIVVGDGCTDDTAAVVASFGDARIRWHNLERNSGSQSAPNNAGFALARGEWIAYLGHDDLWHPRHLESMLAIAAAQRVDIVSSLLAMIGPPGTNYRVVTGIYSEGGYREGDGLPPSGLMMHRSAVERAGGWPDYRTIWRNPDTEFVYRAYLAGCRFASTARLTAFKFNSAIRRNCYVEKPDHEQRTMLRAMRRRRCFVFWEALKIANVHLRRLPVRIPELAAPPDPHTLGWHVTQYRKFRGLE